jgi:hypothetical protein
MLEDGLLELPGRWASCNPASVRLSEYAFPSPGKVPLVVDLPEMEHRVQRPDASEHGLSQDDSLAGEDIPEAGQRIGVAPEVLRAGLQLQLNERKCVTRIPPDSLNERYGGCDRIGGR